MVRRGLRESTLLNLYLELRESIGGDFTSSAKRQIELTRSGLHTHAFVRAELAIPSVSSIHEGRTRRHSDRPCHSRVTDPRPPTITSSRVKDPKLPSMPSNRMTDLGPPAAPPGCETAPRPLTLVLTAAITRSRRGQTPIAASSLIPPPPAVTPSSRADTNHKLFRQPVSSPPRQGFQVFLILDKFHQL